MQHVIFLIFNPKISNLDGQFLPNFLFRITFTVTNLHISMIPLYL